ncbi:Nif3-like dinuclear metal center hexameric protein [Flavobacteriaceae bacterium S356]|uniref:GTP cyclohydrolase 1 type 2 homolog n=1 Tax=Asprobacillus argus TaxID=3076534 RepID=A0ABU3LH30_9FLAO|nr:Nif3-like dinuclear metal center hexameric protein [Flavobacteriaceae bacterium S356]
MTIREVANYIEEIAPLAYAEDFDNVGLLVGNYSTKVNGILVTLDTLEETIDEAIAKDCNLIVSFHPIIFSGLKKLNGSNYVERIILKAIQNNIAIYATHTALDNSKQGVSAKMCEVLGLQNPQILVPKKRIIHKLTVQVPGGNVEELKRNLFAVGAGNIGNYDSCSFSSEGISTHRGNEDSNPAVGEKGRLFTGKEVELSITYDSKNEQAILKTLQESHPYEEIAYDVVITENVHQNIGMGMVGELSVPMAEKDFLLFVKETMKTDCIRHSDSIGRNIKKVAVLGGSGSFAISNAISCGADAYISADFKYHDFFKAEGKILLTDVGHYESEQFTKNLLVEYLTKKITNFAPALPAGKVILSEKSTNPIYYL